MHIEKLICSHSNYLWWIELKGTCPNSKVFHLYLGIHSLHVNITEDTLLGEELRRRHMEKAL